MTVVADAHRLQNTPTSTDSPYAHHSLENLAALLEMAKDEADDVKTKIAVLQAEISRRVAEPIKQLRHLTQKFEGSVSCAVAGCEVRSNVPKRIEWDSDKLLALASVNDELDDVIDLDASIPERVYAAMPADLQKLVSDARTLKHGKETIEVKALGQ